MNLNFKSGGKPNNLNKEYDVKFNSKSDIAEEII